MAHNDGLSDEQIEKINDYAAAFRQEFETSKDQPASAKYTKDDVEGQLDGIVPDAIASISWVLKHETNMTLRTNTAKWLIDKKLEVERDGKDPLYKFLDGLTEKASSVAAEKPTGQTTT
jgi:hypothetical protein